MLQKFLEFLFSLQRVKITTGTRFHFAIEQPGWIFPAALVLAAIGYWSYQKQSTTPTRRRVLGVVRALLLISMLALFCKPQLVLDREERSRSVVAVWVDNSMSMTLADPYSKDAQMREILQKSKKQDPGSKTPEGTAPRADRYELAVDALGRAAWIRNIVQVQDVAIYNGSSHAQLIGTAHSADQVAGLLEHLKKEKPTGESTDLPSVVQDVIQSVQGQRISAVVVLTDGQTTEKGSRLDQAIALAQRSNVKVFSLPLGQADEPLDFKLAGLQAPENTFVRDPVAVKATLSATGIDRPTQVKVTLYRQQGGGEQPLASKEFLLEPGKKVMPIELVFKPEKKSSDKAEKYDLIARVEPVAATGVEELDTKNNVVTGHTNVLDAKITVLYVDGYPRWEYRYLKNELVREKTIEVSSLLLSADENYAQEGNIPITRFPETTEELNKYDVLLIGDVDPNYFSPSQQRLIVDFVRKNGGGVGWIAGAAYNPESYKGTPLEVLLPIIPDEIDPRARIMAPAENTPFTLALTAAGRESNLFRFFDDPEMNLKQVAELPELYWFKPVQGLKPSAEVLAVHPSRSLGGSPMPLLVTAPYGRGRTLFSGICDTWRWRRYTGEPLFQSYWLQMCRLLYRDKAMGQNKRIEMQAESPRVEVGQPIRVSMEVRDPTLVGQIPQQVSVQVIDAQGRPTESILMNRAPGVEERLVGVTTATTVGPITLAVQPGTLPIDVAPYEMEITPPSREFEKTTADMESLTMLANKTTGQLLPLWRGEELQKLIPDRSIFTLFSDFEDLWPKPIALILIVVLATVEWLLRKAAGLI